MIPVDEKEDMLHSLHVSYDELDLYIHGRLDAPQVNGVEAHLSVCETCRGRLSRSLGFLVLPVKAETTRPKKYERRSQPRFSTGDEATIQELHPLSLERRTVQIVNISKNGLGFLTSKFVAPGTIVQVRSGGTIEFGEVRHCLAREDEGFYTGLRLQHDI